MRRTHLSLTVALLVLVPGAVLGATSLDTSAEVPEALPGVATGPIPFTNAYSEPSVDFTPDGRMFVTAIQGLPTRSPIWEKVGTTWVQRGGLERTGEYGGGDADLEFDSLGRGYHSDLWLGNDGMSVTTNGVTWTGAPISHYVFGNDRQWLAHYQDKYLFTVTNQLAAGGIFFRADISGPAGEKGAFAPVLEMPLRCQCGPPGFPAVDQTTGTLYMPMASGNSLFVYRFFETPTTATGFVLNGMTVLNNGNVANLFPVAAVDEAGNVYVAFSQHNAGQYRIFVAIMKAGTTAWTVHQVSSGSGTHVFPWVVAGEAGKIGLAWYGTTTVGNPNSMPSGTKWDLYYAQSLNAVSAGGPTFSQWVVLAPVHDGSISLNGLFGGGDRSLGDFLSAAIDPTTGKVHIAHVRNSASIPGNQRGLWVTEMPAAASPLT